MPPLDGRRLWFVGIGGAGLSAYAQLAAAWGAEVGGWDRVRTPYLAGLPGVAVEISPEPSVPEGWEVVVSSAYPGVAGRSRADFLAELVGLRRAIVVSGAHGKSTTSAMIAFGLRELGGDPAWLIGAAVPQLGGNAGAGEGWLVVEGDESDRTAFRLRAEIAVITNVELDHHTEYGSLAELEAEFDRWADAAAHVVRDAPRFDGELVLPGEHNRRNAGLALAALDLTGADRTAATEALGRFTGTGRRFEATEAGDITIVDDYAHAPAEIAATIAAAREAYPGRRVRALFQPHLVSRTRHLAGALGGALAAADEVIVTDIYLAREEPDPATSGKLVVDALSDRGRLVAWMPEVEVAVSYLARRAEPGDVLLVLGAGDIDRAPALLHEELGGRVSGSRIRWSPQTDVARRETPGDLRLEQDVPLSRFTTIGTGGPARFFARPESVRELEELLGWAAGERLAVEAIGLGSNLLVADEGFEGLVVRLAGELAAVRVEGETLVAGGGAANAVCLHRARAAGLGGFEFASAIPGTAGGGVRMNAGAYGSDWRATMIDALVVGVGGSRTMTAEELGLAYRRSSLEPGEVVGRVRFRLARRAPDEIKAEVSELLARRKATQPTTKRTFGSVFKNPDGGGAGRMIEECGLKGHRIGGAVISERHANFIENGGGATSAEAVALMAEARRRVLDRFGVELEHEVRLLGPIELPPL